MATILDIDCELRQLEHRRRLLRDAITQSMLDMAAIDYRENELLDQRKLAAMQETVTGRINQPQGPA